MLTRHALLAPTVVLGVLALSSCRAPEGEPTEGRTALRVWAHSGQDAERAVLQSQAERFNEMQSGIRLELTFIPEGSYNDQVQAAALAGDLPDALELDGPFLAAYAWQGHLQPVGPLVSDSLLERLLPSIVEQGTWRERLWALGAYDSGLGLFVRPSLLAGIGRSLPAGPEEAWTAGELEQILAELAERDDDGAVLDLHLNYPGEWYTYAFAPALHSAGGGLLRFEPLKATGILDGAASVRALERLQTWIVSGWVDPNLDDAAFVQGRVAMSWSGHWDYRRYEEAWGDDVAVVPLPDMGRGSRTAQGSWVWAVAAETEVPGAVAAWIRFLLSSEEVATMTDANAAVPALREVADQSSLYGPNGRLRLLFEQLDGGWAVPRPRTPAYPITTSAFQAAFDAVRNGEDVSASLTEAAAVIDREIEDNSGYRPR